MSKNAANKRRNRHWHKDQFSRYPRGKVDLGLLISRVEPQSKPLMDIMLRHMDEAAAETRVKYAGR